MRSSTILLAAAAVSSAAASPLLVKKSDFAAPPGGDIDILNYALTLEYLERKFYQEGLTNFTASDFCQAGFDASFYANLNEIYVDEQSHVSFLATALGDKAVQEATYSFPVQDVKSFVALSASTCPLSHRNSSDSVPVPSPLGLMRGSRTYSCRLFLHKSVLPLNPNNVIVPSQNPAYLLIPITPLVLEGVGVSAYLGAAAAIANKAYLTAAGSILTVEARHVSYIRAALGESPIPKPYDTPLDFNQVYSLAAQFITGFAPGTAALPFMAFPPLSVLASQYPYIENCSSVTFDNAYANAMAMGKVTQDTKVYAVFYSGLDTYYVPVYISQGNADVSIILFLM
jgi:hypothetical protein